MPKIKKKEYSEGKSPEQTQQGFRQCFSLLYSSQFRFDRTLFPGFTAHIFAIKNQSIYP